LTSIINFAWSIAPLQNAPEPIDFNLSTYVQTGIAAL